VVKTNDFNSFNELKTLFPHADQVGKLTVFNIAGNKKSNDAGVDGFARHITHHGSESRLPPMLIVNAKIVMLKKNTMTQ